ncbi:MAG: hypothetical protein CM15mP3_09750 [Candidatus Poseidoniales archaeon]|nr:MAG: hypothetical protein CM15mP3_09750 [Candidatus Poseidoniales archaeon]
MSFIEELKNNRDKQIMAISIVFFVLAFPIYFGLAAQGGDDLSASTAVATYEIDGERQYYELGSGDEFIADGETLSIDNLHTDSIDDADEMNIIGVRLTMTYTEAEDTKWWTCNGPLGGQPAADTITGTTMHGEYNETASGSNNGNSGSHTVEVYWISNVSLLDEDTVTMSKSDIIAGIDAGDLGLGAYMAEISVDAEAGNEPPPGFCQRSDAGEDVAYTVEIIVFDYDIKPYVDLEEL